MIGAMLDKGKGLLLGKLKIIEIIEEDLQMIVRMHAELRNDHNVRKNE